MLRLAAGIVAVLVSLPGFAQSDLQLPAPLPKPNIQVYPRELQILFTNYLLGYYRIPDVQTSDFQADCKDAPASFTKELLDDIEAKRKGKKTILVGMGDNYAVELGARTYQADGNL